MASSKKLAQLIIELPHDDEPREITTYCALIIIGPSAYLASGDFVKRNNIPIKGASDKSTEEVDLQGKQYITSGHFHATYRLPDDLDVRLVLFKVVVQDGGLPENVDLLLSIAENAAPSMSSRARTELNLLKSSRVREQKMKGDRKRLMQKHNAKLAEEDDEEKAGGTTPKKADSKTPKTEDSKSPKTEESKAPKKG